MAYPYPGGLCPVLAGTRRVPDLPNAPAGPAARSLQVAEAVPVWGGRRRFLVGRGCTVVPRLALGDFAGQPVLGRIQAATLSGGVCRTFRVALRRCAFCCPPMASLNSWAAASRSPAASPQLLNAEDQIDAHFALIDAGAGFEG